MPLSQPDRAPVPPTLEAEIFHKLFPPVSMQSPGPFESLAEDGPAPANVPRPIVVSE